MDKNIYRKMSSYLREGMYVLLVTTFENESGKMTDGLKKAMHVNSNKCEYNSPVKIHMDHLISNYEPMVEDFVQDKLIKTGLDIEVIHNLSKETGEVVVATFMEGPESSSVQNGMKMYIRKDGSTCGHIGDGFLNRQVIQTAKMLFGTGEYRYASIEDKDMDATYKVLFEDIE